MGGRDVAKGGGAGGHVPPKNFRSQNFKTANFRYIFHTSSSIERNYRSFSEIGDAPRDKNGGSVVRYPP